MFITYVALLHKVNKKSKTYGVIFPDFPGCVSAGKTVDQALENARKGLIFHMEGLLEDGETLPNPTSLESIIANSEFNDAIPSLVHIIPPSGNLKRVNICIDARLLAEIDQAAKSLGKNRSEFLSDAARECLT